jgi:AraC-like DNA-binding protein
MDALSDVLKTVRLTGAIFFDCSAQAPWVAEQPPREMILAKILPGAEHLIAYHLVMQGGCYANIIGGEPMRVEAGELLVFPHGDPHVLSSSPGMRVDPSAPGSFNAAEDGQMPLVVNYGNDAAAEAKFICGYLACDARPFNPLIESLPKVIKIGWQGGDAGWLGDFARVAKVESTSKRRGGESVLAKLSELMFIEVLRRYLEDLPPERAGWLAGLLDPFVGKALSLMHESPAQNWTVDELAKGVFVSRSVLAERFTNLVGIPPMQYLAQWRMQIAWGLLRGGSNIASVAAETGYGSEAAFSRAFKKAVGMSPSAWRRGEAVIPGRAQREPGIHNHGLTE